jgi:hypothetical protein
VRVTCPLCRRPAEEGERFCPCGFDLAGGSVDILLAQCAVDLQRSRWFLALGGLASAALVAIVAVAAVEFGEREGPGVMLTVVVANGLKLGLLLLLAAGYGFSRGLGLAIPAWRRRRILRHLRQPASARVVERKRTP